MLSSLRIIMQHYYKSGMHYFMLKGEVKVLGKAFDLSQAMVCRWKV